MEAAKVWPPNKQRTLLVRRPASKRKALGPSHTTRLDLGLESINPSWRMAKMQRNSLEWPETPLLQAG